jgi:hypothetical protein
VHAANPPQEEGLGADILQLKDAEEVEIQRLQLVVLELQDALQDGGVVLGVRIYLPLHLPLQVLLEHVLLNSHYPLENCKDIRLSECQRVEEEEALFYPTMGSEVLAGCFEIRWDCFLEVDVDDGGQELVHALLVRRIGIELAPYEQNAGQ